MKKLVLKVCSVMFFAVCFTVLFSMNAMAYIDPSVMTYAIQAIAGIAIAIGAAIGMYWRSAKKKISKKLGVDENKNKEVEADEIVVNKQEKNDNIVE
ncbi:MAG: hypothetical protein IKE91_04765 [Clostridia bacterium]|nr:hypothetical protein [Clostridia bacterium]